ncbi:uncharacterized protein F4812DRAFT_468178 [Daldinia caldariorum]|uniref:uncharacterized protein n=1 Tax=Daldinia caldariorum TaxID=326644 RepID=UPI00200763E9|nr:uncharacterized protein F4812DRAFT_468178 [Daldinia caldariorum]KAI1464011.1 hypothetical protein F4812DRAFT_468178 [Daldinia caldariorum]
MKNSDVFTSSGYDTVVSVTQKSVNDQLMHLADPDIGIIKTSFILSVKYDEPTDKFVSKFYDKYEDVPKDPSGKPLDSLINANYMPKILIEESGTEIFLILHFDRGSAWRPRMGGFGLTQWDMAGWEYGIGISLDLAGIGRSNIGAKMPVPQIVIDRLTKFVSEGFSVAQLFVNFESTELVNFDPNHTKYFKDHPKENPLILGYTISDQKRQPPHDENVPPCLKPIGQTFSIYFDSSDHDRSTINFVLNTEGGEKRLDVGNHPTPGNFDYNWIQPQDQCDGKMIYSSFSLYESLILRLFYESFSTKFAQRFRNTFLKILPAPSYKDAKSGVGANVSFQIAKVEAGDDQYTNKYSVNALNTSDPSIQIRFSGEISFKKTARKALVCLAEAWASSKTEWSAEITLIKAKDKDGKVTIQVSASDPVFSGYKPSSGQNECAAFWKDVAFWVGTILDALKSIFTFGLSNDNFFKKLFMELLTPDIGSLPGPTAFVGSLDSNINSTFMLPAGQVFFSKLTYKTDTYHLTDEPSLYSAVTEVKYIYEETPCSRLISIPNIEDICEAAAVTKKTKLLDVAGNDSQKIAVNPSPLAAPIIDVTKLNPTIAQQKNALKATVSSELMSNIQQAMPVAPSSTFDVVKDNVGNSLIFTIGSEGSFQMLQSTSGKNPDGWSSTNLLGSFRNHSYAVQFDVTQDIRGRISLAFILQRKTQLGQIGDLPKFSSRVTKVNGLAKSFIGDHIQVGSSDDNSNPQIVVVGDAPGSRHFYQVNSNTNVAIRVEFPEGLDVGDNNFFKLQMGFNFSQRANYFLYKLGESVSLIAKTIGDDKQGTLSYDYSPGNLHLPEAYRQLKHSSVDVSTARAEAKNPSSDIYIRWGRANLMEQIAKEDSGEMSLWVEASPSSLYLVRGERQEGHIVKWSEPVLFAKNVLHMAPLRVVKSDSGPSSNMIFTLDTGLTVTHYWQDPSSTLWSRKTARVGQSNYVVNFNSFTTQFHLGDELGVPVRAKVKITSSEWQYATVNGLIYSLDSHVPAEVETDEFGNITIISTASDVAPAVLHITSDVFKETLSIFPNGKIHHHLLNITDGTSLRAARTQDGKSVLPNDISEDVSNGIARSLSMIRGSVGNSFPPHKCGNIFTAVEMPNELTRAAIKHDLRAKISPSTIDDEFYLRFSTKDGSWAAFGDEELEGVRRDAPLQVESWTDVFGDIWHWLENAFDEVVKVIEDGVVKLANGVKFIISKVGEGFEFVLQIGDKTIRLVLDTLVTIYKGLNFLLKLVGIDLDKVLAWFGHLLGWDHIWATHKVIAETSKSFLDYGVAEAASLIESTRAEMKSIFSTIGKDIKNLTLPPEFSNQTISSMKQTAAEKDNRKPDMSEMTPAVNMATYHLRHAAPLNKEDEISNITESTDHSNPIVRLFEDVFKPVWETIEGKLKQTGTDLVALLTHGTIADLQRVCADFADIIISALAAFIDGVLKLVEDLIVDLKSEMEKTINTPVFGALYEFICELMGEKELMTVVNVASLIAAIPATTVAKIATGSTPDEWCEGIKLSNTPEALADVVKSLNPASATSSTAAKAFSDKIISLENMDSTTSKLDPEDKGKSQKSFRCPKELRVISYLQGVVSPICAVGHNVSWLFSEAPEGVPPVNMSSASLAALSKRLGNLKYIFSMPIAKDNQEWWAYCCRWVAWVVPGINSLVLDTLPKAATNLLGFIVNCVCLTLSIITNTGEGTHWSNWLTDMASNGGGIISSCGKISGQHPVILAGMAISTIIGGGGSFIRTAIAIGNDEVWRATNVGGC